MELKNFMHEISKESNEDSIEPYYDRIGDSIILYFDKTTVTYGDRIGSLITIYKSRDDDSLAGFEIKGVREIIREFFQDKYEVLFEDANRKYFRRLGDFLKLYVNENAPHPEQLEAYKMLLDTEIEGIDIFDILTPLEVFEEVS